MGNPFCCLDFLKTIEISDWISFLGIIVNSVLAFWIVKTIQNRLTNRRVLKDHFINEIKELRNEYRNCLSNLYAGKTNPRTMIPWFKLMNIKVTDLMKILKIKYEIDENALLPYQRDLQELVTNNEDFISQFKTNKPINFSSHSLISFVKFQQENNQLFNDIIIRINDSE